MKHRRTALKTLIAPMATVALMATTATADRVEWPTAQGGNGHEYEVVLAPAGISWTDARAAAEAAGGHLATVSDMDELDFINNLNFAVLPDPSLKTLASPWQSRLSASCSPVGIQRLSLG